VGYRGYPRAHPAWTPPATEALDLSADPHFRGDADLPNPEQLLVLAASSCQLLSFLAVAAKGGVDVLGYVDDASGEMPDDVVIDVRGREVTATVDKPPFVQVDVREA
jgi:organic hydroperoxide reductase OsmC/OhrA